MPIPTSDYQKIMAQLLARKCTVCDGKGHIVISQSHPETSKCEKCKGTGLNVAALGRRPKPMENKFR